VRHNLVDVLGNRFNKDDDFVKAGQSINIDWAMITNDTRGYIK
jgi:hypothetical protein